MLLEFYAGIVYHFRDRRPDLTLNAMCCKKAVASKADPQITREEGVP